MFCFAMLYFLNKMKSDWGPILPRLRSGLRSLLPHCLILQTARCSCEFWKWGWPPTLAWVPMPGSVSSVAIALASAQAGHSTGAPHVPCWTCCGDLLQGSQGRSRRAQASGTPTPSSLPRPATICCRFPLTLQHLRSSGSSSPETLASLSTCILSPASVLFACHSHSPVSFGDESRSLKTKSSL